MQQLGAKILVSALLTGLSITAIAEVYSWRDENGVLHYGDRPGSEDATIVPIQTRRTDRNQVAERFSAEQQARQSSTEDFENAQASEAAAAEAAQLSATEKAEACTKARETLTNYINARRLYRTNDQGEREYLDSEAIDSARANAEKNVADKCR